MNNKLISYEKAVELINGHAATQRAFKKLRNSNIEWMRKESQRSLEEFRPEINHLLSIIAAHKQARKLYGALKEVQGTLGMSTELRKKVDKVLG